MTKVINITPTPEHNKREVGSADIDAAYKYVDRVIHTADDSQQIMWHGWHLERRF